MRIGSLTHLKAVVSLFEGGKFVHCVADSNKIILQSRWT